MAEGCALTEDQDRERAAMLREVRAELRALVEARMGSHLSRSQQFRYDLLCQRERDLLQPGRDEDDDVPRCRNGVPI